MSIPSPRNLCRSSSRRGLFSAAVEPAARSAALEGVKRVLFASAHSIVAFSNGASKEIPPRRSPGALAIETFFSCSGFRRFGIS